MSKRFVTIWFRYLKTDWFAIRRPALARVPFVLAARDHGRMIITSMNSFAQSQGITPGMVLADARAMIPSLFFFDDNPPFFLKLLNAIAEWCIRYSPVVAVDAPDGIILDVTGCAHLWGGEESYLENMIMRIKHLGYQVHASMADTISAAWAVSHFGRSKSIIAGGEQTTALLPLPTEALRLEPGILERMHKLGFRQIKNFIFMPRSALSRRFGPGLIKRLDQALGNEDEIIQPIEPIQPCAERLHCPDAVVTAAGIEIALHRLLERLCIRLKQEQKGFRAGFLTCYRTDGNIQRIDIGTNRATNNPDHLFKLFQLKISSIEPALGIELFVLEALKTDAVCSLQENLWEKPCGLEDVQLSELLDRLENKIGSNCIHRYLPDEHHWPERSVRLASSLDEKTNTKWRGDRPRPLRLLSKPEPVEVTAPIPDYPPMLFRYQNQLHRIKKADGPERIECEWWIGEEPHRDYYCVEDENGYRFWLFRAGHYSVEKKYQWFIHGFFA